MSKRRLDEIKNLLYTKKKVFVNELSELYGVSVVSIRKYLTELEKEGFAKRFYGGATLIEDLTIPINTSINLENSTFSTLAYAACEKIEDGDIIFLGSGRTCCVLAKLLHKFKDLTVVTNNITALNDLLASGVRIYLLGGEVTSIDDETLFSSPENLQHFTENICVNKAFTSISGIDKVKGLTVNSIISTYIYRYIPTITNQWFLLASSDKFNKLSMYPVAEFNQIHCLITDENLCDYSDYEKILKQNNVNICVAKKKQEDIL